MRPGDHTGDVESFPNLFLAGFKALHADACGPGYIFELSDRRNDSYELLRFLHGIKRMFGFNNMSYDWPMLDFFMRRMSIAGIVTAGEMWAHNEKLTSGGFAARFDNIIWKPAVPQVDMFMLHHLDRFGVGLKQTEFAMRSRSIGEMPFAVGAVVPIDRIDEVISYNAHDINETEQLVIRSKADIEFREGLGSNDEWLNYNDGKIGKKFFENELKAAGVRIYNEDGSKRSTPRKDGVRLASVILPFIRFTRPELQMQLERFLEEHIFKLTRQEGSKIKERMLRADGSEVAYVFSLDGFEIDVKLGGIHGSVEKRAVFSGSCRILDYDVTSYYPSIAIVHRIYPLHLGPAFCDVYGRLKQRRIALPKEDPARTTLKFALNVPFGDSNSRHGIFFDPAYMLAITINGQLMLCMLAEQLANVPGVELIQVNTDGVTARVPPARAAIVDDIMGWWQRLSGMDLERAEYRRMFIRDANNYIAESIDGKRKRKGAYDYNKTWRQDHSSLVIPKAAETAMFDDRDPECYIRNHSDAWDFMLFRKGRLERTTGEPLPKNIRYYISHQGTGLIAVHPPLKGKSDERRIAVHGEGLATAVGGRGAYECSECGDRFRTKAEFDLHNKRVHCWKIELANTFDGRMPADLDFRYYVNEANKLVIDS